MSIYQKFKNLDAKAIAKQPKIARKEKTYIATEEGKNFHTKTTHMLKT